MLRVYLFQLVALAAVFICSTFATHLGMVPVEIEQQGYGDFPLWLWYSELSPSYTPFRSSVRQTEPKTTQIDQTAAQKRTSIMDPILFKKRMSVLDPILFKKRMSFMDPILFKKRMSVLDPILFKKRMSLMDPILF
ncbi:unnamed protein product [Echinostoma caproni]|uniref:Uncharacterized protein n=1 Tax=Echinostoma caproni TaxID=27848 RepID=A0A183ABF1_9TREM|nr:unnamed protein product [Echinostoma caproni]